MIKKDISMHQRENKSKYISFLYLLLKREDNINHYITSIEKNIKSNVSKRDRYLWCIYEDCTLYDDEKNCCFNINQKRRYTYKYLLLSHYIAHTQEG